MNRRCFLRALVAAPVATMAAPTIANARSFRPHLVQGDVKRALVGEVGPIVTLPTFNYPDTPYEPIVWPRFGIPYKIAEKGFDEALADGDIDESGDLRPLPIVEEKEEV